MTRFAHIIMVILGVGILSFLGGFWLSEMNRRIEL